MKKIIAVIIIVILAGVNVNAQEIKFGAKIGLNYASIVGDNTEQIDPVTSFNVGVLTEIPISEKFSFQPELMYFGQGYNYNDNTISLNYLSIPVIGKYYLIKGLNLVAGPQIGFLLYAKNDKASTKDLYNSVDFGINFGVGYKLDNGINFGARYIYGLTNINNVEGIVDKNKNVGFQLSIGYFFF